MSWYPLDGTVFFVGSTTEQGPLDIVAITNFSWQEGIGRRFFSTPSRFQESRINVGLSRDLDWREVMSWYAVRGAAYTIRGTTQQEPGSIDACWRTSLHGVSAIARGSVQPSRGTWTMFGHGGIGIWEDCLMTRQ